MGTPNAKYPTRESATSPIRVLRADGTLIDNASQHTPLKPGDRQLDEAEYQRLARELEAKAKAKAKADEVKAAKAVATPGTDKAPS